MSEIRLHCGDSVELMRGMPDNHFHSICVDPPYGLSEHSHSAVIECLTEWLAGREYKPKKKGFMGRAWDAWVPGPEVFREALRVLRPGGHMLCFAGTRSMDLMMMAIRLAGFELRDGIGYANDPTQAALMAWVYGSGFPKNRDISKDIDRMAGAEREVVGKRSDGRYAYEFSDAAKKALGGVVASESATGFSGEMGVITKPATPEAEQWDGWGTALKPAWEPIILARKPLDGTIAENVLKWGTGALNIQASRVGDEDTRSPTYAMTSKGLNGPGAMDYERSGEMAGSECGRWPANVIHDGSDAVLELFPETAGAKGDVTGDEPSSATANVGNPRARVPYRRTGEASAERRYHESGKTGLSITPGDRREPADSAARFFYCAKASAADRHEGLKHPGHQFKQGSTLRDAENLGDKRAGNHHPTVKPTDLMRYLVRMVTPPGGHVLDFCMGSGSTGKACDLEGFDFTGIDMDPEYVEIARARISADAPLFREAA